MNYKTKLVFQTHNQIEPTHLHNESDDSDMLMGTIKKMRNMTQMNNFNGVRMTIQYLI